MRESPTRFVKNMLLRSTLFATALLIAAGISFTALRSPAVEAVRTVPAPAVDEQTAAAT
jgi:hypothetical protein